MKEGLLLGLREEKNGPWSFYERKKLPPIEDDTSTEEEDTEDEELPQV